MITDYFNAGQRPAIDSGFSVSRVGSSAQTKAMKQVASSLKIELASYREMLSFAQFGSDLDESTKKILTHGAVLMETLKQKQYSPYPLEKQILELFAVKKGYFDCLKIEEIASTLEEMDDYVYANYPSIISRLKQGDTLTNDEQNELENSIKSFFASRK